MLEEFISKIQYLIGDYGYKFLCSNNQRYSNPTFQTLLELEILLDYLTGPDIVNKDSQYIAQLVDFFEAKYNFNVIPYIEYPNRITNVLTGYGTGTSDIIFSGIGEAPYDGNLYARRNGTWQSFITPIVYTQSESDARYYPLNSNPSGYLTSVDSHNPATISLLGITNGLSISGQEISIREATTSLNGVLSASDKIKLNSLIIQNPVTIGMANGLSLSTQEISLALATILSSGAMSAADKIKLESLSNYTHPTGFTNAPISLLTGNNVVSRILVDTEGHVTGVDTRALTLANLGITPSTLSKTNDTNVTLTLGGTPAISLLQDVSLTLGWTGKLAISRGGTGASTLSQDEILIGNGVNPITTLPRLGIDTRTAFPPSTHTLNSHSDVNTTVPSIGQVIGWNGTVYTNLTLNLDDFNFTETDPVFTAFRDANRVTNTFYSAPNGSSGGASFRVIAIEDIPNVYLRYDTEQNLTELQKQNIIGALGIESSIGTYEPAFQKGDIDTTTPILSITNGTSRIVGLADVLIDHNVSGWMDKSTLATDQIISNLTVDEYGHISDWVTRKLTLEDLGFVAFDPSTIESTLTDHENRISNLENEVSTFPSDKNYIHIQPTPATVWTYTHGMNKKPSVTIIDSAGSIVLAKLTYIDLNNIEIDFNGSATAGEAINN